MLVPASLSGRLLAAAAAFVALAILVAGIVIAGILGHFVRLQLDGRLDAQIVAVASALQAGSGTGPAIEPGLDGPPFDRPGRGWYWQASRGGDLSTSRSLGGATLAVPPEPPDRGAFDLLRPWPAEIEGPCGERLIARVASRIVDGRPAVIVATAPRDAFVGPLLDALIPTMAAMLVLGIALFGALILQVRLGLRPLRRVVADLRAIEAGEAARLPDAGQPAEVQPLVAEINRLLERNEAGLERARRHVANLAHGLKTPLATLSLALGDEVDDRNGRIAFLVQSMDRLIRHHLARARTAAVGDAHRLRTELAPRLDDLLAAMRRIHADRPVHGEREGPDDLVLACDPQDCDELFGNLLDNAFRHAGARVRITLEAGGKSIRVVVDDDGPGLPDDSLPDALAPGRRLDETRPGYGFGLPIAREIAELYGGDLALSRGALGGLAVAVVLPSASLAREAA